MRSYRERVREEYDALVQNIFSSAFDIKRQFDEYREQLHQNVLEQIAETRREALLEMGRRFNPGGSNTVNGEEVEKREIRRYEEMRTLQQDNYDVNRLLLKMKAMNAWKINHDTGIRVKMVSEGRLLDFSFSLKNSAFNKHTQNTQNHKQF